MEVTGWTIYWLTRLDSISGLLTIVVTVLGTLLVVGTARQTIEAYSSLEFPDQETDATRLARRTRWKAIAWATVIELVISIAVVLTPTTKEAAAILVIPALAESEDVRGLGEDLVGLAREWIQELRPERAEVK